MPKVLKRSLIAAASLALFFGALELVLRAADFSYPPIEPIQIWNRVEDREMRMGRSMHVHAPRQLWVPDPGAEIPQEWAPDERINSAGYRGPLLALEKKPGVLRIATLGDSSTFGHSVRYQDTYSAQLERLLRERGVQAEVLCGGVVGFTIRQGLERYRDLVRAYQPDVVIEAFGAVNDHLQALQSIPDKQKIAMQARLGGWWTQAGITARKDLRVAHLAARLADSLRRQSARERERIFRKERYEYYLMRTVGEVDWKGSRRVPLEDFEACLLELQQEVEADGGHLMLLSMPRLPLAEKHSPVLLEYSHKIAEVGARQGLDVIDGRAALADAIAKGTSAQALFADHYHPRPAGHRVLAEALCEKILERLPALQR